MAKTYGIKWRDIDDKTVRQAVKSFNAKRARIIKKEPDAAKYLPPKASVRSFKKNVVTRQEFNREINSLRRFVTNKNAAEKVVAAKGVETTKWELQEIRIKTNIINRRRKAERIRLGIAEGSYTEADANLAPRRYNVNNMSPAYWKKFVDSINRQARSSYLNQKAEQYKQNYMKALTEQLGPYAGPILDVVASLDAKIVFDNFFSNATLNLRFPYTSQEAEFIARQIEAELQRRGYVT